MKTVLITGGSRGIGRAMVRLFAARGWVVAFTYKDSVAAAEELSRECGALALRADSASEQEVMCAVRTAVSELGHIGCLVNNAAIDAAGLFTETDTQVWDRVMNVNLRGAFLYTRALLPEMIRRGTGRIINISSMWGVTGASCEVAYSAAKAGLIGMTKALAKEVGPSGVTVNAVCPGVIDTEMNARLSAQEREELREQTPLCRIGKPEEIAEAVYFLAGEGASFITGEILNVNGGFVI